MGAISGLKRVVALALGVCLLVSAAFAQEDNSGKVGIFDMPTIRQTPLDPEVIKTDEKDGIVTEYVRYTSVPGVRALLMLSYKKGSKALPGILFASRFSAEPRVGDAKLGFCGVAVSPPTGNKDPKKLDSVGGPVYNAQASYRQLFNSDPNQSYLYHHVVALVRAMDYLETRPEINLGRTSVMGQDWTGMVVSLMHALDNRPGAYFVWQGAGFFSDAEGNSGDLPARISRDAYQMYSPGAYGQYGTQPIFMANPLNSDLSQLDAVIDFARSIKSIKVLAYAPNREEVQTARHEFDGSGMWQTYFLNHQGQPPTITDGAVEAKNGKIFYSCTATGQNGMDMLVSYGKPGNWTGRNWHRVPMHTVGKRIVGEVPIYDPTVPFYVIGQMSTRAGTWGERGNIPLYVDPSKMGIKVANAQYPHDILTGAPADEMYVATYPYYEKEHPANILKMNQPGPTPTISSAYIPLYWDGMTRIKNVEPMFWKNAKEVSFWMKGDGKKLIAPVTVYFAYESRNSVDRDQQNYTAVDVLKPGEVFPATWKQYHIPLKGIGNLKGVDSLFFETSLKPLQIAALSWH